MLKIAVLVSGGGTNLQAIINEIQAERLNCKIVKVISSKPGVYALERAAQYQIPTEIIESKNFIDNEKFNIALTQSVKSSGAELVVLAGYLSVVGKNFVKNFSNRIINVHPSLVPAFCGKGYYGVRVHEAVIKAGVKVSGATVHFVDDGCDTGPIILQKAIEVLDDDTPLTLQKRIMEQAEWVMLPKAIELIEKDKLYIVENIVKVRKDAL